MPFDQEVRKTIFKSGLGYFNVATSVLVINCGSSSIKYALVSDRREDRIYGLAENLGAADARIKGITVGGEPLELSIPYADHAKALETLLARLANYKPQAIGHRVVHGGSLTKAELLTPEIIERIRAATPLAPLHNPAHLIGIEATMRLFPELPQVAVFDTAFHQTMPAHAYRYAIPKFYIQTITFAAMASTAQAMLMYLTEAVNWLVISKRRLVNSTLGQW